MKTIKLLEKLVEHYEKAVEALKNTNGDFEREIILSFNIDLGVCWCSDQTFSIYIDHTYWIRRHMLLATMPDYAYWVSRKKPILERTEYRLKILKAELKHHKRWGIFAKYFKPKV